MSQHDVITSSRLFMVKDQRPGLVRVGMLDALATRRPTSLEWRQVEDLDTRFLPVRVVERHALQWRLPCQFESRFHHCLYILWRQSQFAPAFLQLLVQVL